MKKLSKLSLIAAVTLGGALVAQADQTNVVQTITMKITAYTEDESVTNGPIITRSVLKLKAATKDIIELLADATGATFSPSSKLLLISPLPEGDSSVVVQDGTNRVDVTGFFDAEDSSTSVGSFQLNTGTGVLKATDYGIFELKLRDNGGQVLDVHFDVSGFATVKTTSLGKPGAVIGTCDSVSANMAGTGDFTDDVGTHDMVVQVTLTTSSGKTEVVP